MLPEGWKEFQVADVCRLINGRGFKPYEWVDDGYPIIRIQNLNGSDEFNYYKGDFDKKILVKPGQLLFAWSGSKGTSFGPHIWNGPEGLLNYHTWKIEINDNVVSEFFLQHLRLLTTKIESRAHGASALVHTQKGEMERLKIVLPPLPEQRKIAAILRTWDEAIEKYELLIEKCEKRKKGLMQQLLTGKKRLPGVSGDWKKIYLDNVAHITMGTSPKSQAYNDSGIGIPLIQGNADIENRVSLPRMYTSEITKQCEIGDILITVRAPVGYVALSKHKACIGRGIASIRSKSNIIRNFLYYNLLFQELKWSRLSQGSTFDSVNSAEIKKLKLFLPDLKEQQRISDLLSGIDKELALLHKRTSSIQKEKKLLMQKLLTGKWRVKTGES